MTSTSILEPDTSPATYLDTDPDTSPDTRLDTDLRLEFGAGSGPEDHEAAASALGFSLQPADAAEAALRRRCVGATLLAMTVFSLLAIPAAGIAAVVATLILGTCTAAFGYAWWRRNQAPNPFGQMVAGAPLPSSFTASRVHAESEPLSR